MTDTTSPEQTTDSGQEARKEPSDARVILGPLVKYAAMGLVLVGIIVTTAVMLDRQFNTIDQEVAALQAELEKAGKPSEQATEDTSNAAIEDTAADTVADVQSQVPVVAETPAAPQPVEIPPVATAASQAEPAAEAVDSNQPAPAVITAAAPVVRPAVESNRPRAEPVRDRAADTAVTLPADEVFVDRGVEDFIADRNAYLQELDRQYLERLRASRDRQLQLMRERMARYEQRAQEMERRYQDIYDVRAADLEAMQERRESYSPDRI